MRMNRQCKNHARSFFYCEVQPDFPLVSLNNSPTDCQPHATPIRLRSQTIERFENSFILMLRYLITIVDDLDTKHLGSFSTSLQDHINRSILRAVSCSIFDE